MTGMRPHFVAPELDPELGIAHCLTPEALDRGVDRDPERRGGDGGVAHLLRRGGRRGRAGRGGARPRRAADGRRGLGRAPGLPRGPAAARAVAGRRPGDLEHAQDRGQPHPVGDRAPRARRSGWTRTWSTARSRWSSRPAPARCCSARWTPPAAWRRPAATTCWTRPSPPWPPRARRCAPCRGSTCSTSGSPGGPGVAGYDPLRLAIDVRGTGENGYELARILREGDDVNLELAGENVIVAVFGMGEPAQPQGERLRGRPPPRARQPWRRRAPARELRAARRPGASWCSPRAMPSSPPRRSCPPPRRWAGWPRSRWPPTRRVCPTCFPASG